MIKAIFSDIDGTLLTSTHKITENTKAVVQAVMNRNIPFVLVTARMPSGVLPIQRELNIQDPLICYSGALVLKENENQKITVLHSVPLSEKVVQLVYEVVRESFPSISLNLYSYDKWFVNSKSDTWVSQEKFITNVSPIQVDFDSYLKENHDTHKILCMGDMKQINKLEKKLKSETPESTIYKSKDTYLEIMNGSASKSHAIQKIEESFQISKNEIMAIGDNFNDMDMLSYAGLGVAMGNSPCMVKKIADYTTFSNDEEGLRHCLEKYVLQI